VRIDIWSDIVCPFCYIGGRHLQLALERFDHAEEVEVVWRSFELDPRPVEDPHADLTEQLAAKYGMSRDRAEANQQRVGEAMEAVGLEFNWRDAHPANTFDAHRLAHLAAERGLSDQAQTAFKKAYFTDGRAIGDHQVLRDLAIGIGLDADEVDDVLSSDRYADQVRADESQAQVYGITAVPTFVLADQYSVSGAQPVDTLVDVLDQVWSLTEKTPLVPVSGAAGESCGVDGCD
jgi:predicted DsbA family dithiol-disulfide isomerase